MSDVTHILHRVRQGDAVLARIWFYDRSAAPDEWSGGQNVDEASAASSPSQ